MKTTISDIANRANVSKMTVSRVLSGKGPVSPKTAERINAIIDEMGYQPNLIARSLSSKRTMIIGVIIPKIQHMFLDNYIAQILSGITDIALQNNYRIMLCPIEPRPDRSMEYINLAKSKLFDGMILVKAKLDDPNINALAESDFPFVLVNYKKFSKKLNFVDSRNVEGATMAIKYLYDSGHRDIAFVAGSIDETNAKDRLKGYLDTIKELGLEYNENWIVYGDFNKEKAFQEAQKILNCSKRPTAIFCADDSMAIGVIERLRQEGLRVPNDIAVMGFDDIEIAEYIKPALTTIRQPIYELGKTASQSLLNLINGKQKPPLHKLLDVKLIKRESA
ncbi:MAG TPA: LacI family DNA-binding transcriptional regulator [bacterium]|nr:LacI family DNA-binding transcriptional regulator [bacterium]HPN43587.1 LacI family DNA-binding transcriptional regulator [bacterium]